MYCEFSPAGLVSIGGFSILYIPDPITSYLHHDIQCNDRGWNALLTFSNDTCNERLPYRSSRPGSAALVS